MTLRAGHGWQVILADLSLILFIVIASAFATGDDSGANPPHELFAEATDVWTPASGKSLAGWLAARAGDPRETVTITARYEGDDPDSAAQRALALLDQARAAGFLPRTVVEQGATDELFASVSFTKGGGMAQALQGPTVTPDLTCQGNADAPLP
ncbi:hypothetical protein [Aurantiacibacter luteus]|uniref:Uncharacterized protein n=1 Tax=Aurantiacibacter luteus TaxID=1581420 RepID=A0A0G9MKN9_9SPHN|nr:hypothetical protein [Aurantiacibacter luteus]KLE31247.1 hypothetical protein AAW00_13865 [Aurantiacibacter luteus]